MQRETAAKSGKIAPFVFVNSGNFHWLKCVENIPIFTSPVLTIRRNLQVFMLSFAQFESAMFVFCVTSCITFWDTHFVEETRKMAYFERVTPPRTNTHRVPSNHNKQWHCDLFVSGGNAHKSLRTCRACSRKLSSIHMGVWFPRQNRLDRNSVSFVYRVHFFLLNGLWKGSEIFSHVYSTQEVWFLVFSYVFWYAFRLVVYKCARVFMINWACFFLMHGISIEYHQKVC